MRILAKNTEPALAQKNNKLLWDVKMGQQLVETPARMPGSKRPRKTGSAKAAEMLSQKGAMALARRLEQFWHTRGYPSARFWAEPIGERFEKVGTYEIYRVVSNLVNGIPPRYMAGSMPFHNAAFREPQRLN